MCTKQLLEFEVDYIYFLNMPLVTDLILMSETLPSAWYLYSRQADHRMFSVDY